MCYASVYEAKTQFSKYISMVESGDEKEIIVLKNGKKVAKIVPFETETESVRLGAGLLIGKAQDFVMDDPSDSLGGLFGY